MDPLAYVKIGESIASLSFIGAEKRQREDTCKNNQTRIEPNENTKDALEMFCEPNSDDSYCCYNSEKMCDFSTTPECPIFYNEMDRKNPLTFFTAYPSRHKFSLEVFQENGQDVNPMERMPKNPLTNIEVDYWYRGGYRHGVPHSSETYRQGQAWYKNGDIYVGRFEYGKKEGEGTYYFSDGAEFFGEFVDDLANGRGFITYSDGSKYAGNWKNGKRDGKGLAIWPNKDEYDGDYKNGEMEGEGILTLATGEKFDGTFRNNNFYHGKVTNKEGKTYEVKKKVERLFCLEPSELLT